MKYNSASIMEWKEFVPTDLIKALIKHFIGNVFAILTFGAAGKIGDAFLKGFALDAIHFIEGVGIIIIIVFLLVEIAFDLWKILSEVIYGKGDSHHLFLVF